MPNFEDDKQGLKFVQSYLLVHGFDSAEIQSRYCRWDITATKDDKTYYIEVKRRKRCARDGVYDDTILEISKLQSSPCLSNSYVINLFTDCFSFIPYTAPHKIITEVCQKYSWRKEERVPKTLVSYPNHKKYLHSYDS